MSECKEKSVIVYRIEVESDRTHIRIETRVRRSITERLGQSLRDPGYYGPSSKWEEICRSGADSYFAPNYKSEEVYLSYTHAFNNDGYCSPRLKTNDDLHTLAWATKLLTKVSRQIAKENECYYGPKSDYGRWLANPETVIQAIKDMGAIEIEYTFGSIGDSEAVERFSPAHQFIKQEVA